MRGVEQLQLERESMNGIVIAQESIAFGTASFRGTENVRGLPSTYKRLQAGSAPTCNSSRQIVQEAPLA